jgi:hypothetical protein
MPDDLATLRQQTAELKATMDRTAHVQQIQFTRIAQIEADLDLVRGAEGSRGVQRAAFTCLSAATRS